MNRENIEEILKDIGGEDIPAEIQALAEETSEKFIKTLKPSRQHILWSGIMKNRIIKLAAAAVIIIAIILGIHYFGGSIDGATVAWADVAKKVEQIQTFIYRTRQTETSGPQKGGFEFVTEQESISYNSSEYGNREEFYDGEEIRTRSYSLRKEKEFIGICPLLKTYERHPLTETNLKEMDQMNPRQIVGRFMSGKWKELGYDTINGTKVKGIEANDPNVLRAPPPPVQNFIARLWVDVETELPVWIEVQFVPPGSTVQTRIVIDRFQWNAKLSAEDFEPNIPADYKLDTGQNSIAIKPPQPPQIDVNAPKIELPNIDNLTLLGVNSSEPKETITLVGRDQIWQAQDEIVSSWPAYSEVKEQLREELRQKLGIQTLSSEQIVATAIALREKFWEAGGDCSKVSYPYCYAARLLLESVHDTNPDNFTITDELVETIQSMGLSWIYKADSGEKITNVSLRTVLTELRSAQFEQMKKELEQGRPPAWDDFVRVNDLAILLGFSDDYEHAEELANWLISEAERGGWTAYMDPLKKMQNRFNKGEHFYYNVLRRTKSEFPEEFRYGRRLPSFKGPKKLNAVPVHLLESNPVWYGD
jgi:outer membrane lipoprotein-sorting protein